MYRTSANFVRCQCSLYPLHVTACGGNNYYCNGGARKTVSPGYYTTGGSSTTRTGQTGMECGFSVAATSSCLIRLLPLSHIYVCLSCMLVTCTKVSELFCLMEFVLNFRLEPTCIPGIPAGWQCYLNPFASAACGGNNYYCTGGVRKTASPGYYTTGGTTTTRTGQKGIKGDVTLPW